MFYRYFESIYVLEVGIVSSSDSLQIAIGMLRDSVPKETHNIVQQLKVFQRKHKPTFSSEYTILFRSRRYFVDPKNF